MPFKKLANNHTKKTKWKSAHLTLLHRFTHSQLILLNKKWYCCWKARFTHSNLSFHGVSYNSVFKHNAILDAICATCWVKVCQNVGSRKIKPEKMFWTTTCCISVRSDVCLHKVLISYTNEGFDHPWIENYTVTAKETDWLLLSGSKFKKVTVHVVCALNNPKW